MSYRDKNPPLSKSQRQVSASPSDGITIPVITASSSEGQVEDLEEKSIDPPAASQIPPAVNSEEKQGRKGRPDRADARRYHTAGAIEDIKV